MAPMPPTLTETDLLQRYHDDGDQQARQELVERMLPFVRRVARGYANRGEPLDDLVQVGCVGLLKAIDRFDLSRGVQLRTFAEPNVRGEIRRHFRDHGWSVHMPRDLQELHAAISRETRAPGRQPRPRPDGRRPRRAAGDDPGAGRRRRCSAPAATTPPPSTRRTTRVRAASPRSAAPDEEFARADRLQLLRVGAASLPPARAPDRLPALLPRPAPARDRAHHGHLPDARLAAAALVDRADGAGVLEDTESTRAAA